MLGDTSVLGSSDDVVAEIAVHGGGEVGGVSSNSGGEEDNKSRVDEGDRSFGGNRWPRQETLALLKIRSDMDQVFRDSSFKGPLWEEVSRKLAELGYNRSAKKCKEKFENVYKYHKRTKDGRTGKHDGKAYRFFDQLEAFGNQHSSLPSPSSLPKPQTPVATTVAMPWTNPPSVSHMTVPSTTNPINVSHNIITTTTTITNPTIPSYLPLNPTQSMNPSHTIPSSFANISANLFSSSTSSSTASDEEFERRGKRKRKWKEFFKRLTKEVMVKQEELQKKFLETIEKREHERIVREEAWRIQEIARINREHEILIQERSTAAAKDAAVIAFLQKISGQQQNPIQTQEISPKPPPPPPRTQPQPPAPVITLDVSKTDNGDNVVASTSSRWPKAEVEALIMLRTTLDVKYQENGPKGPLWEEISTAMRKHGYNRSSKRCKEKWENINKYFKKVKESNKKRPEDSKTCPYFQQLDALYKEKNKIDSCFSSGNGVKPINPMEPLMVQPEQQWPPQQDNQLQTVMEDMEKENVDHIQEDEEDGDSEEEEEEEDGGGGYEIVANKPVSMDTVE